MVDVEDKIFNNDPIHMKSLVGKKVELTTIEDIVHCGIVYVIDPIYKTVVLHTNIQLEGKHETVFVLYHAIKTLKVLSDEVDKTYVQEAKEVHSSDNNEQKRIRLKKWLEHMFISVTESGDYLKIDDHLVIAPPYGAENCICNSTIILNQIQKIINLMPPEFCQEI